VTLAVAFRAVQLHQHAVVDIAPEGFLDGLQIRPAPVSRELHPVRQPAAKIVHERQRIFRVAPAYLPRQD
jgi:hypothetical protein